MTATAPWPVCYVGIPFVELGFDYSGCHCWGLVCLIYQRELGIALDRYDTISAEQLRDTARAVATAIGSGPWLPVASARRDFDVVLLAANAPDERGVIRRMLSHVGVAYGPRDIVHVERGVDTACVRDDHPSIRRRIVGAYRHRQLA